MTRLLILGIAFGAFVSADPPSKDCGKGCPKIMRPVCGSDGKKYNNQCELTMAACKLGKDIHAIKGCPRIMIPVCGSNGKKYNNQCEMTMAACKVGKDIHAIKGCPRIMRPVCGSDGKMYNNQCEMTMASCKLGKDMHVIKGCPRIMRPVCGSDGKKYNNQCEMTLAACKLGKEITVVKCEVNSGCQLPCKRILLPVCGSDGKTYGNQCLMRVASCEQKTAIIVVRKGKCMSDDDAKRCVLPVPPLLKPVCGSDGKRYNNRWIMLAESCKQKKAIIPVSPFKDGTVCSECNIPCNRKYEPVCGSDGKTHSNLCMMLYHSCKAKMAVVAVHEGRCK